MGRNPLRYFSHAGLQRNQKRLDMLLGYQSEGTLLDVGCGKGGFLAVASSHFEVVGIDRQPEPLQPSAPDVSLPMIRADINTVRLEPDRYNVITMFNFLEHVPDPDRVIEQAYAGLKDGGVLFGSVPNNSWGAGKIQTVGSNFFDRTHCSTFHPAKWLDYFGRAGFQDTRHFGEILLGRRAYFCTSPRIWQVISFNLMFLCRKEESESDGVGHQAAG